ncbi:MAG: Zn-ribbon domain-containing OB-fold protein [Thermoflexales bacterium]|nr:Zn-ribbon domain-containing OB-fold protein [Thermoflexales bacterium]
MANNSRPFTANAFNQYLTEHKLMGTRCTKCGGLYLPPRAICPACHSEQLEWIELSGQGKLAAFSSVFIGPSAMNAEGYDRNNPYCAGIVELAEGVKISARVLGLDAKHPTNIVIGTPLTVEFLDKGEGEQKKTVLAFKTA